MSWTVIMSEVWVLGGTGRSGRAIAAALRARDLEPVLVGRDQARLIAAADGARTVRAGTVDEMAAAIRRDGPAVVVNTVGPFARTAEPIARAALAVGAHYLDLANDVDAASTLLALDDEARRAGSTLVTGAGFGVTAAESVALWLCRDETPPESVRVDTVPSLALEEGPVGEALAATLLEGFEGGAAGRHYRDGRLVPVRLAGDLLRLRLPDGDEVTTVSVPFGDLIAAQRVSGAPNVVAGSSEVPSSPWVRAVIPVASVLLRSGRVRRFAIRRLAGVRFSERARPRAQSWAHASARWADGRVREGWLRLGDAQEFTGGVPAEIARRLVDGEGAPGATTPAAMFGTELAAACGGEFSDAGVGPVG
jgi:short subunit dehydrogenase-like uncharacterized protein